MERSSLIKMGVVVVLFGLGCILMATLSGMLGLTIGVLMLIVAGALSPWAFKNL